MHYGTINGGHMTRSLRKNCYICNLKLLFVVHCAHTTVHRDSGRRKWILHKFFILVISFHCFVPLCGLHSYSGSPYGANFYNVTFFFVLSFAIGIKIYMLTIRRVLCTLYLYQELCRGRIYQNETFWRRMERNQRYNVPKLKKYKKKIRRESSSTKWVASYYIL